MLTVILANRHGSNQFLFDDLCSKERPIPISPKSLDVSTRFLFFSSFLPATHQIVELGHLLRVEDLPDAVAAFFLQSRELRLDLAVEPGKFPVGFGQDPMELGNLWLRKAEPGLPVRVDLLPP